MKLIDKEDGLEVGPGFVVRAADGSEGELLSPLSREGRVRVQFGVIVVTYLPEAIGLEWEEDKP